MQAKRDAIHNSREIAESTQAAEGSSFEENLPNEYERARVALNNIEDAVIWTDRSGKVTFINRAAEETTGWTLNDGGIRISTQADRATQKAILALMAKAVVKSLAEVLPLEGVLIDGAEEDHPVDGYIGPIIDRSGDVTGEVVVLRNTSASKRLTEGIIHSAQYTF
jgi:PAS domain-containing protein